MGCKIVVWIAQARVNISPHAVVQCIQSAELQLGGCFEPAEEPLGRSYGALLVSTARVSCSWYTTSHAGSEENGLV